MSRDITLWTVNDTPRGDLPQWTRTTALMRGDVYVPAAIGGDEQTVALGAALDSEPVIVYRGHAMVRAAWLRGSSAAPADLLDKIERAVGRAAQTVQAMRAHA